MIPESDQIFTEVELSTLEKAINETTVLKDGVMLGEGGVAVWVMTYTFTQGHGIECACFVFMPLANVLCVSVFPNAQPDPIVSGGNHGSCIACGVFSRVGVEPSDLTALGF